MARLSKQDVKSKAKKIAKPKKAVTKPGQVKSPKKPVVKPKVGAVKVTKPKAVLKKKEVSVSKPLKILRHKPQVLEKIIPQEDVVLNKSKVALQMPRPDVAGVVIRPPKEKIPSPVIAPKEEKIKEEKIKVAVPSVAKVILKELELKLPINVKDLSVRLQEKPSVLIKTLMGMRVIASINQVLEEQLVNKICEKYGYQIKKAPDEEELALRIHSQQDAPGVMQLRAPIVTLMGHVDHGKTSLLDGIRKTKVAESEHGGITQHIGAYRVVLPTGEITFLDTPGHEAFTAMRARGARITDIVVLVVAADEGIMPQTQEAIDHARAAGVGIIVAINKIDKTQADIDRVKKQLSELNLAAEDWGGKTITVPVSAKTGKGIDELLEMILLEAQMLELKANPKRLASGVVIEAKLTRGKGSVATLLIQNGTLHLNENIVVGKYYAKARAMFNDHGQSVSEARPSFPVEVLGLSGVPDAGEKFFVIEDEKLAKELVFKRQEKERQEQLRAIKRISLEDLYSQIKEGRLKELKLIIKADVQGTLEAIKDTLNKLNVTEIKLDIIHEAVGTINTSDVILAVASNALILGFHVTADERAKELIAKEGVDVRTYNIIYELANDIKQALEGMLEPKLRKIFLGRVEVRKIFKVSRVGTVAGCYVNKGKIMRTSLVDVIRNGQTVFEGKVSSLKHIKDDAREATEGFECGITLEGFDDFKEGDIIEAYEIEKIARKL
jgi:translation initiation factor IF-2